MRQTRQQPGPATFPAPTTAPWMKWVFVAEVAVFVLAAVVLWDQWESAQTEFAIRSRQLKSRTDENAVLHREQENNLAYLNKFENDPEFKLREGRQRLGFAQPGEVIFRMPPPPPPAAAPAATPPPAK